MPSIAPDELLWLLPALPLAGAALLGLFGRRLPAISVAVVGVGSVTLTALLAAWLAAGFELGAVWTQPLWNWMQVGELTVTPGLRLDGLALVMVEVVTGIGALVHLYSARFMAGEPDFGRFFAWLNLFVAAMLILVLADDLALLFLGWEGVGLCSYLLIGFWYRDSANGDAARKAFVMTRCGDALLLLGIALLFKQLGTLEIQLLLERAAQTWVPGDRTAELAALLLLAGALGKSAQLPLQTWLPDAMAGPTPVSALIHAATMVTAGVYLLARLQGMFALAPPVQGLVAILGAATLLLAAGSALVQRDIKRVLAYSTMSQLGYMFLALGVGAAGAAIFHLLTHAIFKSLLFLSAGALILAHDHRHDITLLGDPRRLPLAYAGLAAGCAALAALPWISAGYYSKSLILEATWRDGGLWLWLAGWMGALLTGLYAFRLFFVSWRGSGVAGSGGTPPLMAVPLAVLTPLALVGGWLVWSTGQVMGVLAPVFGSLNPPEPERVIGVLDLSAPLTGLLLAFWFWALRPAWSRRLAQSPAGERWRPVALSGWGFERAYGHAVASFRRLALALREEPLDRPVEALASMHRAAWRYLSVGQNGRLRRYAGALAAGVLVVLGMALVA